MLHNVEKKKTGLSEQDAMGRDEAMRVKKFRFPGRKALYN